MTQIRQNTQVYNSNAYDDTIAPAAAMEPAVSTSNLQVDLDNIRSILLDLQSAQAGGTNWYDGTPAYSTPNNRPMFGSSSLNTDLTDLEDKPMAFHLASIAATDLTVAPTDNGVTPTNTEIPAAPFDDGASGTSTANEGNVCASGATIGTYTAALTVAGTASTLPLNQVLIRNGATLEPIIDAITGNEILGLLQTDAAINTQFTIDQTIATQRVQISFVSDDGTGTLVLAAIPTGVTSINYFPTYRIFFDNIPEDAYLNGQINEVNAVADVTLSNAYANQSGNANLTQNIVSVANAASRTWSIEDSSGNNVASFGTGGGATDLAVTLGDAAATTSVVTVNGDDLDINVTNVTTVANGMTFEGTPNVDVGVTDGLIESTAALTLESNSADVTIQSTGGGNAVVTSAASVDVNATTTVTVDTADAADASTNSVTITAGSSTGGTANGASITLTPGDGFTTGVAGLIDIVSPADETEATLRLSPSGTNAEVVSFYSGSSDPNATVTGTRGSLFLRDNGATGQVWVNTDNATTWSQLQAGAPTTTLSQAITNEGVVAFTATNSINWNFADTDGVTWGDGTNDILSILRDDGSGNLITVGDAAEAGDRFVSEAASNDFDNGISVDTVTDQIDIGVNANVIEATDTNGSPIANQFIIRGADNALASGAGWITLTGGDNSGAGPGGNASLLGGDFTGSAGVPAGSVLVRGGSSDNSSDGTAAGGVSVIGGAGNVGSTANGGAVTIVGGVSDSAVAGGVTVTGGVGATTSGSVTVTGGAGDTTNAGGNIQVDGGAGGVTSGNGGGISIRGGAATDGNGGAVSITGRDGTGTNRDGGAVTLVPGAASGSGTPGEVIIDSGILTTFRCLIWITPAEQTARLPISIRVLKIRMVLLHRSVARSTCEILARSTRARRISTPRQLPQVAHGRKLRREDLSSRVTMSRV